MAEAMDQSEFVNFRVGGMYYSMRTSDIKKYPGSYFNAAIKKKWRSAGKSSHIEINRNGELFQYICDFHFYGELPLTARRLTVETVRQIRAEADFYNVAALVDGCEAFLIGQIRNCTRYKGKTKCVFASQDPNHLVNVLGSVWAPFCTSGELSTHHLSDRKPLFKSSTFANLNIAELLEEAKQSPFGRGVETLVDTSVRNSFEIPESKLNSEAFKKFNTDFLCFAEFAPRMKLDIRPYKLVIYQEGGFFSEHRDSVRGENHIGTLVYILNSAFTGGELIVRQNDVEKSISKPEEWIAMYGDCPHRIEPVTSGTRVSLIFDLYNAGAWSTETLFDPEFEGCMSIAAPGLEHALDGPARQVIVAALDKELAAAHSVVICLTHLYPVCQADLACLKGGDASLYALLQDANAYDVEVVPVAVNREVNEDYLQHSTMSGGLVDLNFGAKSTPEGSVTLIIPVNRRSDEVLSQKDYIEHVGNEAQNELTKYLITGLRVTKKTTAV